MTEKEQKDAVSSLFDMVDADGSGFIEPDEFKTMLKDIRHERLELSRVSNI